MTRDDYEWLISQAEWLRAEAIKRGDYASQMRYGMIAVYLTERMGRCGG